VVSEPKKWVEFHMSYKLSPASKIGKLAWLISCRFCFLAVACLVETYVGGRPTSFTLSFDK
jgi:hypothetical protein